MCSGPEVAKGIMEWITDDKERKRTQVERAASDAKAAALLAPPAARDTVVNNNNNSNAAMKLVDGAMAKNENAMGHLHLNGGPVAEHTVSVPVKNASGGGTVLPQTPIPQPTVYKEPGMNATLGNVSGQDLAKEVRTFLMNQKAAKEAKDASHANGSNASAKTDAASVVTLSTALESRSTLRQDSVATTHSAHSAPIRGQMFGGIEAVAKSSRTREMAAARVQGIFRENSGDDSDENSAEEKSVTVPRVPQTAIPITQKNVVARKRLRYHILVDSGMGRLGFKTQAVEVSDVGVRRDTVEIINELVEMEVHGAPIGTYAYAVCLPEGNEMRSASF